ncbi:polyketide synthase [Lentinula edodes]|nr:polyketide synthase [Lentinula edodes]
MSHSESQDNLPPVAIIGIATELPSGSSSDVNLTYQDAFRFLCAKGESYETFPPNRFKGDSHLGRVITDMGSFLKDVHLFDPMEFGISARDAKAMSPATRKLLELSFLALNDSEIDYRGRNIGCYMTAEMYSTANPFDQESQGSFAGYPYMIANKVSYHLDLTGPSIPVQTACSSSAVAAHLAVQALRNGDCEAALIGGCQLNLREEDWIQYSDGHVLSPNGKCKPLDASADGFAKGEGAVVIVLKLLEDALRDGDHVYALILGTGVSSTGSQAPVSAPVASAQATAMQKAFKGTGKTPQEVSFVELHATGTAVGDPIEANWVGEYFKRDGPLLIGSVKGNFGHLECAAFLASLVKVCLMFERRIIFPTANLKTRNSSIMWDKYHLDAPVTAIPLPETSGQTLVSINSSGIGGVNAHVLLQSRTGNSDDNLWQSSTNHKILFVAGGLLPRSATATSELLVKLLNANPERVSNLSTAFGRRSRQMTWRSFSIFNYGKALQFTHPVLVPRHPAPLVFVFSGQGSQHIEMGKELFQCFEVFRASIMESDRIYQKSTGTSLLQQTGLFIGSISTSLIDQTWPISVTLPALCMFQVAMIDLFKSLGICPDVIMGHSAGETAAMYACGSADHTLAIELAIARSRAMALIEGTSVGMVALGCSAETAEGIIHQVIQVLSQQVVLDIACFNSTSDVVISGHISGVELVMEHAKGLGIIAHLIGTNVPMHSQLVLKCQREYLTEVGEVFSQHSICTPQIKTYSTVTGKLVEAYSPLYFWQNAVQPVLFSQAITAVLSEDPSSTFVEIGPHPVLLRYIKCLGATSSSLIPASHRSGSEHHFFLEALGKLMIQGHNSLDFHKLNGTLKSSKLDIPLPPYPFSPKVVQYHTGSLGYSNSNNHKLLVSSHLTEPYFVDHCIVGEPIMPAAGFIEMVLETGVNYLWDIHFESVFVLKGKYKLKLEEEGDYWHIISESGDGAIPRKHAKGHKLADPQLKMMHMNLSSLHTCKVVMYGNEFYETIHYFAQYGPYYRRLISLSRGATEWIAEIRGLFKDEVNGFILHPALFDACIHATVHPCVTGNADRNSYFLPSKAAFVLFNRSNSRAQTDSSVFSVIKLESWAPDACTFNVSIIDSSGKRICQIIGLEVLRHIIEPVQPPSHCYEIAYQHLGCLSDLEPNAEPSASISLAATNFVPGTELATYQEVLRFQTMGHRHIYLQATDGIDSAFAEGFIRSLNKELFGSQIHLVSFDSHIDPDSYRSQTFALAQSHSLMEELEVKVALSGEIYSPRIQPVSRDNNNSFTLKDQQYSKPWKAIGSTSSIINQLEEVSLPILLPDHVLIEVEELSMAYLDIRIFKGIICDAGSTNWLIGSHVLGVKDSTISSHCQVHTDDIMKWRGISNMNYMVPLLILHLGLGINYLTQPLLRKHNHISVLDTTGSFLLQALKDIMETYNINVSLISSDISAQAIHSLQHSDTILCGLKSPAEIYKLQCMNIARIPLFIWNDPGKLAEHHVPRREMLNATMELMGALESIGRLQVPSALQLADVRKAAHVQQRMFSGRKTYLLIGGIGSLGLQIAFWMFKNGARYITLTSRSGEASLSNSSNHSAIQLLSYLRTLENFHLNLQSCDAASLVDMQALIGGIEDLGGCILSAVVLSDAPLSSHSPDSYYRVFPSKVDVFKVLTKVVKIESLEFLVLLSSAAIFGSAAQSNYASANTAVDHMAKQYRNAFSLIVPAIIDSNAVTHSENLAPDPSLSHWLPWAVSCQDLCCYLEDGIRQLKDHDFWMYVPNLDWEKVQKYFGPSPLYDHLVASSQSASEVQSYSNVDLAALQKVICDIVEISPEDFSPEIPLIAYGMDSLSASRLSIALKPMVTLNQLQLLGNISYKDIQQYIARKWTKSSVEEDQPNVQYFDWKDLNKKGETVIKLIDTSVSEKPPLICIHGASGSILAFKPLQESFESALYAIQVTPDTPLDSLESMSMFYWQKIKESVPRGPYRLAGFSGTCLIAFEIARVIHAEGQHVSQFAIIDYFPTLFLPPHFTLDDESVSECKATRNVVFNALQSMLKLYENSTNTGRRQIAPKFLNAFQESFDGAQVAGTSQDKTMAQYFYHFHAYVDMIVKQLVSLSSMVPLEVGMKKWLLDAIQPLQCPVDVYIAEKGVTTAYWYNWKEDCMNYLPNVKITKCLGDHFTVLEDAKCVRGLEYF